MEITYLGHSGFLAETLDAYFLFDYIRGELPAFSKEKKLYVFASHAHHDHWDPRERNLERAINFKREIDRLKGLPIDVAFIPLDPRQEDAYRFCMDYCMETLDAKHVFPMHFWGNHKLCRTYQSSIKGEHPDWFVRFHPIRVEGEKFTI